MVALDRTRLTGSLAHSSNRLTKIRKLTCINKLTCDLIACACSLPNRKNHTSSKITQPRKVLANTKNWLAKNRSHQKQVPAIKKCTNKKQAPAKCQSLLFSQIDRKQNSNANRDSSTNHNSPARVSNAKPT